MSESLLILPIISLPRPRHRRYKVPRMRGTPAIRTRCSLAYTRDSVWCNRDEFMTGREEIVAFLTRSGECELDYALRKSLWSYSDNRIAVRFQYEYHDAAGQWWRSYGNELWEFTTAGLMSRREASINDVSITAEERRILGPRPSGEQGADIDLR